MEPLRYTAYDRLDGRPHVVVDGSATAGTVLTLSHWPGSATPADLADDLSAQIAFRYLRDGSRHDGAELVSNNHFDQDGLVSVFALSEPDVALAREAFLVDVAAAGDFATYRVRDAARVSMAIAAWPAEGDPYEELLPQLAELCDRPDRWKSLWTEEDARLAASEAAIASGRVTIEEVPALDLAVVTVPAEAPTGGGHRFGSQWAAGLHPMALHNAVDRATGCFALLQVRGRSYELTYRYETWVRYRSRRPRPRVDLAPLADDLSELEPGEAHWVFDGPGALTPRLHLVGSDESAVPFDRFRARLETFMAAAPPAWDPDAPWSR